MAATVPERILVVDDDSDMLAMLNDMLRKAGFDVDCVGTGAQMHEAIALHAPSLVLMDLRLRNEDGLVLARQLRESSSVPIVMLSGSSDETDRVLLLEIAADDFLIKPFSPRELVARVRAVLRRYAVPAASAAAPGGPAARSPQAGTPPAPSGERLAFGPWVLNLTARELRDRQGTVCPLTQGEFRILETLVQHPRRVWTRDQLLEHTRSAETDVYDRTIDVLILRLRRKIEPNPKQPQYICTERGMGYMFSADVVKL